ncbi:MAG: DUF6057 family protein [Bacteroidales bacterium]|nr:DUF6057 family protein [Bacteroidales bacterium]
MKISKDKYFIGAAFVVAALFFGFAYPYHLMRREQMTLFMYDLPYMVRTYSGIGCLSRFIGDFAEQFFCLKAAGPILVSLLLTAIGLISYKIARNFAGKKISLAIAVLIYAWSFLRETETRFMTQYSIAVAGYLLCIFAALKFRKPIARICALPAFLLIGFVLFGSPYHKDYGRLSGKPDFEYEKLIAMDVETYRENWDKVLDISKSHLLYNEACYLHNLAAAMKGKLADRLFTHPQNYANGLFLMVNEVTPFSNSAAGEAWYHLGDMTLADQSAMVSLQFSPKHTGARYIKRLAMINLVSGEYGSAEKYLKMLNKTLFYHNWAKRMTPANQDEQARSLIGDMRKNLVSKDVVSSSNDYRLLLNELLKANPGNSIAREYLLCYYLLTCDLNSFMKEYVPGRDKAEIYQEAVLIWLNIQYNNGTIRDVDFGSFGVSDTTISRLQRFNRYPDRYKNTYWYYFTSAMEQ